MSSIRRYLLTPKKTYTSVATRMENQMKNFKDGDLSPTLKDLFHSIVSKDKLADLLWKVDMLQESIDHITITIGGTSERASTPEDDHNVHLNMDTSVLEYYHDGNWVGRGIVYK